METPQEIDVAAPRKGPSDGLHLAAGFSGPPNRAGGNKGCLGFVATRTETPQADVPPPPGELERETSIEMHQPAHDLIFPPRRARSGSRTGRAELANRRRTRSADEGRQNPANLLEESMHIEIRAKEFTLTDGIRLHIERRLGFALDRFAQRIRAIRVCVGDVNGPRHGADDKCCRLAVRLAHKLVVLEERAADLYEAIDRAAHRVRKMIARAVKRGKRHASPQFQAA